jgi:hypothetical protein
MKAAFDCVVSKNVEVELTRFLGTLVLTAKGAIMAGRPTYPPVFRRKISQLAAMKSVLKRVGQLQQAGRRLVAPKNFALIAFLLTAALPAGAQISAPTAQTVITALHWRNVGPGIGGRSVAVDAVPGTPFTFYFGG